MLRTVLHISTNESTTVRHTIVTAISGHAYIVDPPIYRDGRYILEILPPRVELAEVRNKILAPRLDSPDLMFMELTNCEPISQRRIGCARAWISHYCRSSPLLGSGPH